MHFGLSATCRCVILLLFSLARTTFSQMTKCNGDLRRLSVVSEATGILYSPNYPNHYSNSDECSWVLSSRESGQVVEVEVTDIELEAADADDDDLCSDYLAAYDGERLAALTTERNNPLSVRTGDSSSAGLLKKWCGTDKAVLHSTGQNIFLQFVSNRLVQRKGFVIKYRAVTPYSSACVEGEVRKLTVSSTAPVLLQISNLGTARVCQWQVAGGPSDRLVLEVAHLTGALGCYDGHLAVHDGGDMSSAEVARWCGYKSRPFSYLYTSGSHALLTTMVRPADQRRHNVTLALWIKVQTSSAQVECDDTKVPVLEFQDGPLYFPVPFATSPRNKRCPVHVYRTRASNGGFRLDVRAVDGRNATCGDSPALLLHDADKTGIEGKPADVECWRDSNPVYWTHTQSILVSPLPEKTAFARVQPTEFPCTGHVIHGFYSASNAVTDTLRHLGYPRLAKCQFVVNAREDDDHPVVDLRIEFLGEEGCGDVLTIYDGNTTDGEVLLRYCGSDEVHGDILRKKVVAPGNTMLFVLTTDDDENFGDLAIKYYAVPEADLCEERMKEIQATSTVQLLQSHNFPHFYPLNYICFYRIVTNTTGETVHVRMTSTQFESTGDYLTFVDDNGETLGRVAGGDRLQEFSSTKQAMVVSFVSDENLSDGGWQLEYYSAQPSRPDESGSDGGSMSFNKLTIIVSVALGSVIVVLLLILVVTCCKTRTGGSTPV